jgi:chromosome segregation ATPase
MAYDINSALERLEDTLKNVESAKAQVEKTVKESKELQLTVKGYVESINTFQQELHVWEEELRGKQADIDDAVKGDIKSVKSLCDTTTKSLKTTLDSLAYSFKASTDSSLTNLNDQINKLEEDVKEMNALHQDLKKVLTELSSNKETLNKISNELKQSQDKQDGALDKISQNVSVLSPTIDDKQKKLSDQIDKNHTETTTAIQQTSDSLKESLKGEGMNLKDALTADIKSKEEKVELKIESANKDLKKSTDEIQVTAKGGKTLSLISVIISAIVLILMIVILVAR